MTLKILVLTHEQRLHWGREPGYDEYLRPLSEIEDCVVNVYCFQREFRHGLNIFKQESPQDRLNKAWQLVFDDLYFLCKVFKPDLILNLSTWARETIPGSVVSLIRAELCSTVVSVFFDHDESNLLMMRIEREVMEASSLNLIADSPLRAEAIRNRKEPYNNWDESIKVYFQPAPVSQNAFAPRTRRQLRASLIGSLEGYRKEVSQFLLKSRHAEKVFIAGGILGGNEFLDYRDYAEMIALSLVNIVSDTDLGRSQIKGRVFQTLTAESFLILQRNENTSYFFSDTVTQWETEEDLLEALDSAFASPESTIKKGIELSRMYIDLVKPKTFLSSILTWT